MVWMGLDLGTRRIGVALSDGEEILARPLCALEVPPGGELPVADLRRLVGRHRVGGLLVGLPRRLDGTCGRQARRAGELAARLETELGLPVVMWDERLSSVEAERRLREAGLRRGRRRRLAHQVAAALVLQSFLDRRRLETGEARRHP